LLHWRYYVRNKIVKIAVVAFITAAIAGGSVFGEEKRAFGIIFNTGSLLLDIESYQAGVGVKLPGDIVALRLGGDIFAANSFNTLSFGVGVAVERHFRPGKASPYFGGLAYVDFTSQRDETDADTWVQNSTLNGTAGGILGIEYFLFENLSVFAEYSLAADISYITTKTSTDGTVEDSSDFSIALDTRIGNNSKIGVVIYIK
jgi:hypothetical protein